MPEFLKFSTRLLIWTSIIIIVIIAAWFGWNRWQAANTAAKETTTVQRGTLSESLILSGNMQADRHVTLQFQNSGLLSWVGVKEGDWVKKYQAIASLDQRQLKKQMQKYLNTYSRERNDFEDTHAENENWQLINEQSQRDEIKRIIERSQFDLNNTVLDVEIQDLSVRYATLTTPIEGMVTRVAAPYAGVNIIPSQAQFEILDPSTLFFSVTADQTEVIDLFPGQEVSMVLDAFEEQKFQGKINFISYTPKSGETGTVYEVKVSISNWQDVPRSLRIGMTGDAEFILRSSKDVLYLPYKFVKSDDNGSYVLIGDGTQKQYVKTGLEGEENVEITEGISEGTTVYAD